MANEDFGLSFTIQQPALFTDFETGSMSPKSTIFADTALLSMIGAKSTIFADIPGSSMISAKSTVDALALCDRPSILDADANPLNVNRMAGPGQNDLSTC